MKDFLIAAGIIVVLVMFWALLAFAPIGRG
jgi:hypothetical protein